MPYKIIQSIERGKSLLVAIPEQWEKDGILYWPRRNSEKLQKNEYSEPEINWSIKNCIVKRNNIPNLHEAEAIIDIMCDNSDTEPEPDMSRRTRLQYTSKKDVQINFNDMAQEFSKNKAIINTDGIIEQSTSYEYLDNQESIIFTQEAVPNVVPAPVTRELEQIEDSRITKYIVPKITELSEDLKAIVTTLNTISENQQILFQNQNNILSKVNAMQTQFDEVIKYIFKPPEKNKEYPDIKPIKNIKEFQDFENLISSNNPEVISNIKYKFSIMCRKGRGKGYNNAYILVDALFERNFLVNCSWAGGSKSDKIKICFKSFTNTINFFFTVIHESDEDFTLVDCHQFFKIILRNSLQRCNNKQIRLSAKKNRQKKRKNTSQSQKIVESTEKEPQQVENQPEKESVVSENDLARE